MKSLIVIIGTLKLANSALIDKLPYEGCAKENSYDSQHDAHRPMAQESPGGVSKLYQREPAIHINRCSFLGGGFTMDPTVVLSVFRLYGRSGITLWQLPRFAFPRCFR